MTGGFRNKIFAARSGKRLREDLLSAILDRRVIDPLSVRLRNVREMLTRGLIDARDSWAHFSAIESQLYRYPAVDPASFRNGVEQMFGPPVR
jgi:hypothetical protein